MSDNRRFEDHGWRGGARDASDKLFQQLYHDVPKANDFSKAITMFDLRYRDEASAMVPHSLKVGSEVTMGGAGSNIVFPKFKNDDGPMVLMKLHGEKAGQIGLMPGIDAEKVALEVKRGNDIIRVDSGVLQHFDPERDQIRFGGLSNWFEVKSRRVAPVSARLDAPGESVYLFGSPLDEFDLRKVAVNRGSLSDLLVNPSREQLGFISSADNGRLEFKLGKGLHYVAGDSTNRPVYRSPHSQIGMKLNRGESVPLEPGSEIQLSEKLIIRAVANKPTTQGKSISSASAEKQVVGRIELEGKPFNVVELTKDTLEQQRRWLKDNREENPDIKFVNEKPVFTERLRDLSYLRLPDRDAGEPGRFDSKYRLDPETKSLVTVHADEFGSLFARESKRYRLEPVTKQDADVLEISPLWTQPKFTPSERIAGIKVGDTVPGAGQIKAIVHARDSSTNKWFNAALLHKQDDKAQSVIERLTPPQIRDLYDENPRFREAPYLTANGELNNQRFQHCLGDIYYDKIGNTLRDVKHDSEGKVVSLALAEAGYSLVCESTVQQLVDRSKCRDYVEQVLSAKHQTASQIKDRPTPLALFTSVIAIQEELRKEPDGKDAVVNRETRDKLIKMLVECDDAEFRTAFKILENSKKQSARNALENQIDSADPESIFRNAEREMKQHEAVEKWLERLQEISRHPKKETRFDRASSLLSGKAAWLIGAGLILEPLTNNSHRSESPVFSKTTGR